MAGRAFETHIAALRTEINSQKMELQDVDQLEIRRLDVILAELNSVQEKLNGYYDRRGKLFVGKVQYLDHSAEIWIGKLDLPGHADHHKMVMIRPANIGPGEKLVRRGDNTIMVQSYGGAWRLPPFLKMA